MRICCGRRCVFGFEMGWVLIGAVCADGGDVLHHVAHDGRCAVARAGVVRRVFTSRIATYFLGRRAVFQSIEANTKTRYGYSSVRYLDDRVYKPLKSDDQPRCEISSPRLITHSLTHNLALRSWFLAET
jgi:hypothetical protein